MTESIYLRTILLGLLLWGGLACEKSESLEEEPFSGPEYRVRPAEGKLPWPQHRPEFGRADFDRMMGDLWIVNNYGQYQCGDRPEDCYFHDGLDIVLPNGSAIYAVDAGVVKAVIGNAPFYQTLIVEDLARPGFGWAYTHIAPSRKAGDRVAQGVQLGTVRFQGLEHLHLSRVRKEERWHDYSGFVALDPTAHFEFPDDQAPVVQSPFYFFPEGSDLPLPRENSTLLSGAVDLVVGVRDPGEHAHSDLGYGDRLGVQRIGYRIFFGEQLLREQRSFDFSQLEFRYVKDRYRQALTVFKFHRIFWPDGPPNNWNRFVSHYILTHPAVNLPGEVDPSWQDQYWDTASLDSLGQRKYPDGIYRIEVFATDFSGNETVAVDSVRVAN